VDKELHTAVILEVRAHRLLLPSIDHMLKMIPSTAVVQVFHGSLNLQMLREHYTSNGKLQSGRVQLIDTGALHNGSEVMNNALFMSAAFWKEVRGENVVTFQVDSCVCSGSNHTWSDFLSPGWSFVGAPHIQSNKDRWTTTRSDVPGVTFGQQINSRQVMSHQNGGFALRRKSHHLQAIERYPRRCQPHQASQCTPEDIFFSNIPTFRVAPWRVAQTFTVETNFYTKPFAIHKPWEYLNPKQLDVLRESCPELGTLFGH